MITAGKVFRIAVLPGIVPRTRDLLGGGFHYVSFYIAQIFATAGLLPRNHPYLQSANFGRFGIGHVTAEAWQSIVQGNRRPDQIIIFFLIIVGIAILFLQFCFLGVLFVSKAAHAAGLPANGFFNTQNPDEDIAFILMDSVFGLPDFFNSCVAQAADCFVNNTFPQPAQPYPSPFHEGLRAMLQVYSIGLLTIAMLIFSYFCITVLIETAEHGTPFGKRFSHLWAPIRMVVALALLIPIANGLNASQYIIMYAAKWGSGFATNGWTLFLDQAVGAAGGTLLGDVKTLVGVPNAPPVNTLLEFGSILATCKIGEASGVDPREVQAYVVFPDQVGPAGRADLLGLAFADAVQRSNYNDIQYVFGVYEVDDNGNPIHTSFPGQIKPICGELILQITDVDDVNSPGSQYILEQYHRLITILWLDVTGGGAWGGGGMSFQDMGYGFVIRNFPRDIRYLPNDPPVPQDPNFPEASGNDLSDAREYYRTEIERIIQEGTLLQVNSPAWTQMLDYGWAGAGIWYNNVARMNGTVMGAAYTLPAVRKYPEAMEFVAAQRAMYKQSGTGPERFNPELANGKTIRFDPAKGQMMAQTMYKAQRAWDGSYSSIPTGAGANSFLDAISAIFGTQGLFELSKNTEIHPLAGLVMMGKSLMDAAIRNLGAATAAGALGGIANSFKSAEPLGRLLSTASTAAIQIAMLALTMGFVLFYVLPFIPFLYFFFAVGGWVKGIFEAMVGVPLWALAHIRIDDEGGMPGKDALGGYFMIFEIFLRPILIVFGMLAAITIFGAQVKILNEIWGLVVSNVTGYNATTAKTLAPGEVGSLTYYRGLADKFFYTVMYAIMVYMLGMASFKLIDSLPSKIMRWINQDAGAFADQVGNTPDGLMTKMSMGAQAATSGLSSMADNAGPHGESALRQRGGRIP